MGVTVNIVVFGWSAWEVFTTTTSATVPYQDNFIAMPKILNSIFIAPEASKTRTAIKSSGQISDGHEQGKHRNSHAHTAPQGSISFESQGTDQTN